MPNINNLLQNKFIVGGSILILVLAATFLTYTIFFQEKNSAEPSAVTSTTPDVRYNKESNDKMLKILDERPSLSGKDKAIRDKITTDPNPLAQTSEYTIEYIPTPDQFQVEILTVNINQAKENATDWFLGKGLSHDSICNLPLTFYLNSQVKENLRGSNIEFNPLPIGC